MTDRALILHRTPGSTEEDWYKKGKKFLEDNNRHQFTMTESAGTAEDDKAMFFDAIAAVHKFSHGSVSIDRNAAVLIVTTEVIGGVRPDECMCKCGGNSQSCGGGGGGGSRAQ